MWIAMRSMGFALILVALIAIDGFACATCSGPMPKKALDTYIWITAILSLLPLSLMAGLVYWLVRMNKAQAQGNVSGRSLASTSEGKSEGTG